MDLAVSDNRNPSESVKTELIDPRATEDVGREDTFVDCPDEIENSESNQNSEEKNGDNLHNDQYDDEADSGIKFPELIAEKEVLLDKLDRSTSENERLARENEELLRDKLQRSASENERLARENEEEEKVRELLANLSMKDQEIDFLSAKIAALTVSSNLAQSNSQLYELQLEKDKRIEEITNRMLSLLSVVHCQEELLDGSLVGKISRVEKCATLLVEKHNRFVSESDQLKDCLNEIGLDLNSIDENGALIMAHDKILELRKNEVELNQRLRNLEDENSNLVEQLEKQRLTLENLNAGIGRLSAEVEHERNRYANTKEKLSLAVTKGKALVHQRDSIKQLLGEKTTQLEKYSLELQEKAIALEAAEKTKELVVAGEILAAALQESLVEKDTVLKKCQEILSESVSEEDTQHTNITEKLRWLTDENKSLRAISLHYDELIDALTSFDFPESVVSSGLDVRVRWLAEYFSVLKEERMKLQTEVDKTKEAAYRVIDHLTTSLSAEILERSYIEADLDDLRTKYESHERLQHELTKDREAVNNEIDHLQTSLLTELQEKSNLQAELEYLRDKHEGVVQKEKSISLEKDKIVNRLMEAFGLAYGSGERVHPEESDLITMIDKCLSKVKDNSCPIDLAPLDTEKFESFKSLLYIKEQEMSLYKLIIEEDVMVDRLQVTHLSDELETKNQELNAVKDENAVMRKSREQLEDRCALLKEKLSMAVKKGKGLVQERENLKNSLDEKKTEIDRLKCELQELLSRYSECQDQISKLSLNVDRISVLEVDLFAEKERGDQFEKFLAESNHMVQRVMESIEVIPTPTDLSFQDPVEKVKWVAGYLSELEYLQMQAEKELQNTRDEASSLASKLSEVQKSMQSTENALSAAENSRSQIFDEKKELEAYIAFLEEELHKEKEKADFQASKLEELSAGKGAVENALSQAEDNISRFADERNIAIESRALAEEQLQKIKEEFANQIAELADAQKKIQSLEDALLMAQKNVTLLSEGNRKIDIFRADFDSEIEKLREEVDLHASKLCEASVMIKSLEDALSNAENNMAVLTREKSVAEEEIMELRVKLESHVEELAGTRGSIENELSGQLSRLHLLLEDETFPSLLGECFERKFESLNSIDFLLNEIGDCFAEMDYDVQQEVLVVEGKSDTLTSISGNTFNIEMPNDKVMNVVDNESLVSLIEKMNERFQLKSKIVADKFDNLSALMDGSIATLLKRLRLTKDKIISIIQNSQSLKQQVMDITTDKESTKEAVASLQMENRSLLSACEGAIQGLKLNVRKNLEELISVHDFAKTDGIMSMNLEAVGDGRAEELATDHVNIPDKLLLATRQNEDLSKLFQETIKKLMSLRQDLQNEMKEVQLACDEVLEKRDLDKDRISKMEADLGAQHNMCFELTSKLDEYETKEAEWRRKEMELSSSLTKFNDLQHEMKEVQLAYDEVLKTRDLDKDRIAKMEADLRAQHNMCFELTSKLDEYEAKEDEWRRKELELSSSLAKFNDLQSEMKEVQLAYDEVLKTRDLDQDRIAKMEADLRAQHNMCFELTSKLDEYEAKEDEWRRKEMELSSSLAKFNGMEDSLVSTAQVKLILDKVNEIEVLDDAFQIGDSHESASIRKLSYILDSYSGCQRMVTSLSSENEELLSTIDLQILEIERLKRKVENHLVDEKDSEKINALIELESGLRNIVRNLVGNDMINGLKVDASTNLLTLLEEMITAKIHESESLKFKNEELGVKLLGTQKVVYDLSNKVKFLEESNLAGMVPPEINHERTSTSIASLSTTQSEITEMQDVAALGKNSDIPSVQSAAHVRTLRKGSNDHLAISIDSESERFISNKESDEEKGHAFKSLNNSGLIPRQGRRVADRVDGIWVSGSRALMKHPRGRLGVIVYCLVLHIWLLGAIL